MIAKMRAIFFDSPTGVTDQKRVSLDIFDLPPTQPESDQVIVDPLSNKLISPDIFEPRLSRHSKSTSNKDTESTNLEKKKKFNSNQDKLKL